MVNNKKGVQKPFGKKPTDPCWDAYKQVGMKIKKGNLDLK